MLGKAQESWGEQRGGENEGDVGGTRRGGKLVCFCRAQKRLEKQVLRKGGEPPGCIPGLPSQHLTETLHMKVYCTQQLSYRPRLGVKRQRSCAMCTQ